MNPELARIANQLAQANFPEDVFGDLAGPGASMLPGLKKLYHTMAKVAHPDVYQACEDQQAAQLAFNQLTQWFVQAEGKIKAGQYGRRDGCGDQQVVCLRTKTREYRIGGVFTQAGPYNLYPGCFAEYGRTTQVTLKIVRDPRDNDLAQNEARILRHLQGGKAARKLSAYIPALIDSFLYEEAGSTRQANVLARSEGWYSLVEVHQAYPGGIDPKDMAWMWRRLLVVLGFAHINQVIHGAVMPVNIRILPEQHGLMLENWSQAACDPEGSGERITAVDPAYEAWYPAEILQKEVPVPGTDIYLAARCMIYLLGGDPVDHWIPKVVPGSIRTFLKTCTYPGKRSRPQDAWGLKEEFDELLDRLWGERKFHPFIMK